MSVTEALRHAGWANGRDVRVRWVDSESLTDDNLATKLGGVAGIVVPGGFGHRGIEGKVLAARYARENRVPYLGLCLGLQCGVIEFARDVVGAPDANSTEFDIFTNAPVIDFMPDQRELEDKGGTMRLGLYPGAPDARLEGRPGVRRGDHLRAPPASFRGVQRVPRGARERRHAAVGPVT